MQTNAASHNIVGPNNVGSICMGLYAHTLNPWKNSSVTSVRPKSYVIAVWQSVNLANWGFFNLKFAYNTDFGARSINDDFVL